MSCFLPIMTLSSVICYERKGSLLLCITQNIFHGYLGMLLYGFHYAHVQIPDFCIILNFATLSDCCNYNTVTSVGYTLH